MPGEVLEVRGLECGYGDRRVLHDFNLTVQPGERIALLGPNGSGKSTLLAAIAGLIKPWKGEILLGGTPIAKLNVREIARRVATVPTEESPKFAFTVREIVTMGRLAQSNRLADTLEDVEAATVAMERADCLQFQDRNATELSAGERQRVLIARALAQSTPLILLDEPTSHLDPAHQFAIGNLVRELGTGGTATVSAVHDLNMASQIADRAILIRSGKVVMDDAVLNVLRSRTLGEVYGVQFHWPPGLAVLIGAEPGAVGGADGDADWGAS